MVLEDSAALAGLSITLLGVVGASLFNLPWVDAAASIAIGLLLISVATLLAHETRSLLTGEAAPDDLVRQVRQTLERHAAVTEVTEVLTLQLGPPGHAHSDGGPCATNPTGGLGPAAVVALFGLMLGICRRIEFGCRSSVKRLERGNQRVFSIGFSACGAGFATVKPWLRGDRHLLRTLSGISPWF